MSDKPEALMIFVAPYSIESPKELEKALEGHELKEGDIVRFIFQQDGDVPFVIKALSALSDADPERYTKAKFIMDTGDAVEGSLTADELRQRAK